MAEHTAFRKSLAPLYYVLCIKHIQVHAFYQAAKVNGRWAYSPFRRRPTGPFHPANKAALACVTRSGLIKLLYQNPDSRWTEISAELKNTGYSDRLLTHAAMVATQGILHRFLSFLHYLADNTQSRHYHRYPFGLPEDLRLSSSDRLEPSTMGP